MVLKFNGSPNLQSVTQTSSLFHQKLKNSVLYKKQKKVNNLQEMKKNSGENFQTVQVDPITGDYYITIPEWVANDLSWYEDTEVVLSIEGGDLIISEKSDD